MAIIALGGTPLFVNGGISMDPDCCCVVDPPPGDCPPCCIRITWGTFDDSGNLIGSVSAGDGATVHVTVVMPTPNSRIVCDSQEILVQWEIADYEGTGSNGAWVRFGAAWKVTSNSPAVNGENGKVYDRGLVDWGTTEANAYSATLQFSKCFLDVAAFLGYVTIGMDYPAMELDIDVERCETTDWCCREETVCEDCCALLEQGDVITYDGKYYIVVDRALPQGVFTMVVEFETSEPGKICIGDGLIIKVFLIPPRHSLAGTNNMTIRHPKPWVATDPFPDIGEDGSATDLATNWGNIDAMMYSINIGSEGCNAANCEGIFTFAGIEIENDIYGGAVIAFEDCDMEDCCCPNFCSCHTQTHPDSLRCFWPVGDFDCTANGQFTELGGPTQVVGFTSTVTANSNVFCNGTTNTMTWTQSGTSTHLTMCEQGDGRRCYRSRHSIIFPVISSCGDVGSMSITHVGSPCVYGVGLNGVAYSWWTVLVDIQVRDCSGASVNRTVNQNGVTYTYATSFQLTGPEECPCPPPEVV